MITAARTLKGLIEYRIIGQGTPVLVLNGGHTHCNSPLGHEQFFLKQGCQLIVPSRPGYGKTPSSTGKSAEAFADALILLLDQLHLERVIVVGISAGGRTTLQLAGRHPDRVSKIILQNAITGGEFPDFLTRMGAYVIFNPWVEQWTWAAFRWFANAAPQTALKVMMGNLTTLDPGVVVDNMPEAQRQAALAFLLASRSGSGFLHDMSHQCGDLSRITAPTLIIDSKYDGSKDAAHATYAADHITNAELFITPAESHLMWFRPSTRLLKRRCRNF